MLVPLYSSCPLKPVFLCLPGADKYAHSPSVLSLPLQSDSGIGGECLHYHVSVLLTVLFVVFYCVEIVQLALSSPLGGITSWIDTDLVCLWRR